MGDLIQLIMGLIAVVCGFLFGRRAERKHYSAIREKEAKLLSIPLNTSPLPEVHTTVQETKLVMGSVVIANDSYKSLIASFQSFFGRKLTSFETLLDRARREATVRLKTEAGDWGAKEIVNFRMQTSMLDNQGVEVFASATAIK